MSKKIAIVYDWIDSWGGVERILLDLHEEFPDADFYTSYTDLKRAPWAKKLGARTSFLQKLPPFIRSNRIFSLIFYPFAFEQFDFSEYDVVISISSAFAKGIITKPGTKHICYLLTPPRYLWGMTSVYIKSSFVRLLVGPFLQSLRQWDYTASTRPDIILTISETVAKRCKKYYGRVATVVYPPFDTAYWQQIKDAISRQDTERKREPYYLVVSRLEPYKRVDVAIQAFQHRPEKLVIVGTGTQSVLLKKMAGQNVQFLAGLRDEALATLYLHAEACIMPQEEDFGYVALEAQFFDCPIIAYDVGGAVETVEKSSAHVFFEEQTAEALTSALARLSLLTYNVHINTGFADRINQDYSRAVFLKAFHNHIR